MLTAGALAVSMVATCGLGYWAWDRWRERERIEEALSQQCDVLVDSLPASVTYVQSEVLDDGRLMARITSTSRVTLDAVRWVQQCPANPHSGETEADLAVVLETHPQIPLALQPGGTAEALMMRWPYFEAPVNAQPSCALSVVRVVDAAGTRSCLRSPVTARAFDPSYGPPREALP